MSADLASGRIAPVRDSVALPPGQAIPGAALAALKALAPVTIDVASYKQSGETTASVSATTAKGPWVIELVRMSGRWMIAATEPVQ